MISRVLIFSCVAVGVLTSTASAQTTKKPAAKKRPPNPAFRKVVDDPALPRVLLIGDSISIGYTVPVQDGLKGVANVHRIPVNGGPTTRGVASIDEWLGDGDWDVIHFNFGLHDLKYVDSKGKNTAVEKGVRQVAPADYRKNLTEIVGKLQATGAALIWRPTTPVPAESASRVAAAEGEYNAIAADVIRGKNIAVNDLNGIIASNPEYQKPANVHFTTEGSAAMAESVVASIQTALKNRDSK